MDEPDDCAPSSSGEAEGRIRLKHSLAADQEINSILPDRGPDAGDPPPLGP